MREKKFVTVTKQVQESRLSSVKCDFCGENILIGGRMGQIRGVKLEGRTSYGSRFDPMYYEIDICDDCIDQFKLEGDSD